jgi:hypothetical protein
MSGDKIVVDTNILIYLLEGNEDLKNILTDFSIYISFISEIELLAKPAMNQEEKDAITSLLDGTYIIDVNKEIKRNTIANRNDYHLKLPDGLILATAQWLQLPLLTSDKAFEKAETNTANIIIF